MAKKEGEFQKPTIEIKTAQNIEGKDTLDAQINRELEDLNLLIGKLETSISSSLDAKDKEEKKDILKKVEQAINLKNTKNKLKKLIKLKEDIKAVLGIDIEIEKDGELVEENNGKEEIVGFNREVVMKEFNSFFDELRKKFAKFEVVYKVSDKESYEKLGRNIEYWAGKINDFEKIENPSNEDIKRIMQLHDEIEKWTKENWTELHRVGKFELAIDDYKKKDEENKRLEKKYSFSRKAADIAFAKVDKYEELNAQNEKEGDEKFKEVTRKILEDLVVHGKIEKDEENGKFKVAEIADLDCRAALGLLKMAGVDISKVEYVAPGEIKEGKINIDTGNKEGLHILANGTVIIDHHNPDSPNDTSAAHKVYDILVSLGMLDIEKDNYLRDLIRFVDRVDNYNYPESYYRNYFEKSWKTLYGLSKSSEWDELVGFFKYRYPKTGKGLNPVIPMKDALLQKFGFLKRVKSEKSKKVREYGRSISSKRKVLKSKEELEIMEKEGFIIDSDRYGKICLSINGRVPGGNDATKAFGCDTFLAWNTTDNSFFISSLRREELEDDFIDGLNVRKTMWLNPKDKERHVTLAEILDKMTDGKFEPSEAVKDALAGKVKVMENVEEEEEIIENPEVSELPKEPALVDLDHAEIGHPTLGIIEEAVPVVEEFEFEESEDLSKEEKAELQNFINEKIPEFKNQLDNIENNFGEFLENNLEESNFNKLIQNEIIDIGNLLKELGNVKASDYNTHTGSEKVLALVHKIDDAIKIATVENWTEELKRFKEGIEKEFTEKEKNIIEKSEGIANKYIEDARTKFPWENFPQGRVDFTLETQAVFFLMKEFKRKKFFKGKEEEVAEYIIKNRN